MNIFVGIVIGLLVGGILAWFTASSKAKLSFERAIRDIEGKAKGAEASRDAVQRQAVIFQEEIVTLKAQVEKLQAERLQIEGAIKVSEARQLSHQQKIDEYLQKISLLEEASESLRTVNADQKFQLSMAGERLTFTQQNFEQSQEDISKLKEDLQKLQSENANLQIAISVADSTRENSQESINSHRYQEEIVTLKAQLEKLQSERLQIEGAIKVSEARQVSYEQKIDEYLQKILLLEETNESLRSANTDQKLGLSMAGERLTFTQQNFEQSQEDISKLKEDLQKLQSENASLQIAISVADSTRETSQESINSHRYQDEIVTLKAQLERLSENNDKLLVVNNEQKSQLALANDRLFQARNNSEQFQTDINKLKVAHKNQFDTFKREKNEEITILRRQHQQVISGMTDTFKSLASDILKQESQEFRANANEDFTRRQESIEGIVQPVQENLVKLEKEIRELEKERIGSYHELKNQVDSLIKLETSLRQETGNLVQALKQPTGRGQWGEVVLEKVLELSGMIKGKHYNTQVFTSSNDEKKIPDVIVNLPDDRKIVIDAKAVMSAYLSTVLNSPNDVERAKGHRDHANQLKSRIDDLSKKEYWAQFQPCPEFVVLFLPAESLFSFALQIDENLIEYAAKKKIILATPTTLIALLRTIYYGWQQNEIAKNANEIGQLGNELYDRLAKMIEHFNNVGKSIKKTSEAFDKTAGSFNNMLRPSFNKLREKVAKVANEKAEIAEIDQLDIAQKSFSELPIREIN